MSLLPSNITLRHPCEHVCMHACRLSFKARFQPIFVSLFFCLLFLKKNFEEKEKQHKKVDQIVRTIMKTVSAAPRLEMLQAKMKLNCLAFSSLLPFCLVYLPTYLYSSLFQLILWTMDVYMHINTEATNRMTCFEIIKLIPTRETLFYFLKSHSLRLRDGLFAQYNVDLYTILMLISYHEHSCTFFFSPSFSALLQNHQLKFSMMHCMQKEKSKKQFRSSSRNCNWIFYPFLLYHFRLSFNLWIFKNPSKSKSIYN